MWASFYAGGQLTLPSTNCGLEMAAFARLATINLTRRGGRVGELAPAQAEGTTRQGQRRPEFICAPELTAD